MKKLGKQLNLGNLNGFRGDYGTINYKQPKAVYLNLYSWLTPEVELVWDGLQRKIEHKINLICNQRTQNTNFIHNRRIVDVDLHTNRMGKSKSSFMGIEITLFTKDYDILFPNESYDTIISELYHTLTTEISDIDNIYYSVSKPK